MIAATDALRNAARSVDDAETEANAEGERRACCELHATIWLARALTLRETATMLRQSALLIELEARQ